MYHVYQMLKCMGINLDRYMIMELAGAGCAIICRDCNFIFDYSLFLWNHYKLHGALRIDTRTVGKVNRGLHLTKTGQMIAICDCPVSNVVKSSSIQLSRCRLAEVGRGQVSGEDINEKAPQPVQTPEEDREQYVEGDETNNSLVSTTERSFGEIESDPDSSIYDSFSSPQKITTCNTTPRAAGGKENEDPMVIKDRSSFGAYERAYTNEMPYVCDICKKGFMKSGALRRHIKVHSGERSFSCDICDKVFAESNELVRHKRMHSGEKTYKCDICDRSYTSSNIRREHMKTHSGEKPYSCDICERKFMYSSVLKDHMKTHSSECPYLCEVCDKAFTTSSSLMLHMRTHSGERSFMCELCDTGFTQSDTLVEHMRTHIEEGPYICDICNGAFASHRILKDHMRTHSNYMSLW